MYVITYARVVFDGANGVCLDGVFFGGIAGSQQDADTLAGLCTKAVHGGTAVPRVLPLTQPESLLDVLELARQRFNQLERDMVEAEDTLISSVERNKRRSRNKR